jgi:hypothetical protein
MVGLVVDHNTNICPDLGRSSIFVDGSAQHPGTIITNNIFTPTNFPLAGTGTAGNASLTISTYLPSSTITKNVWVGESSTGYPVGNYFPASVSNVGFTNYAGGVYTLDSTSTFATADSTGGPCGYSLGTTSAGANNYFNTLVARSDLYISESLRNTARVLALREATSLAPAVTYDYANDTYPNKQDAAKAVVPAFVAPFGTGSGIYTKALVGTSDTALTVGASTAVGITFDHATARQLKIDNEIMTINGAATLNADGITWNLPVSRGTFGTTITTHAPGVQIYAATNSLPNNLKLSLNTADGHNYLITHDWWYGSECIPTTSNLSNWKTFRIDGRLTPTGSPGPWYQVDTRFDGLDTATTSATGFNRTTDIGVASARLYPTVGSNVTGKDPAAPRAHNFLYKPNTWIREWIYIEQKTTDPSWTLVSHWMADANNDPVLLFDRLQMEANGLIAFMRIEMNTSLYYLPALRPDLVVYHRNFVVLKDTSYASVLSLLTRP